MLNYIEVMSIHPDDISDNQYFYTIIRRPKIIKIDKRQNIHDSFSLNFNL